MGAAVDGYGRPVLGDVDGEAVEVGAELLHGGGGDGGKAEAGGKAPGRCKLVEDLFLLAGAF